MTKRRVILHTFAASFLLCLVTTGTFPLAFAENIQPRSATRTVLAQNSHATISPAHFEAEASKNHETVAKYYEDSAAEMRTKAQEHKQLLEQYEEKSYLYGKKAQDLQAHASALIRKYEQSAEADAKKADTHRNIASRLKGGFDTASKSSTVKASRR